MEQGLYEKTGKELAYWVQVVKQSGIAQHKAIIDFLKSLAKY